MAGIVGVCVSGPRYRTVWVGEGLREFMWMMRIWSVLVEGVHIGSVHGVEGAEDGVGHSVGIRRRKAKTDRIPVEDLMEEGGQHECVRARVENCSLEGFRRVSRPSVRPHCRNHWAPRP